MSMLDRNEVESATGKDVRVLVIDSGVESSHPHFAGRKIKCRKVEHDHSGTPRVVLSNGVDVLGHGTGVAGVLADHAPGAQIDSVQVLGRNKRGQTSVVLCALEWALELDGGRQRYDIVNCSFGTREERYILGYKRLVDRAFTCNVHLVAASNNLDFRTREYPGSFPSVISTDFAPDLAPLEVVRRRGHLVEFAARGSSVRVPWRNAEYRQVTGSSFAAPQLAALVARIRELRPEWNACQVKAALYDLAQDY